MKPEHKTMKVWAETLKALRLLSALEGKPMVRLMDEMVKKRLKKLRAGH